MDTIFAPAGSLLHSLYSNFQTSQLPSHTEASLLAVVTLFISIVTLQGKLWDRPDPHRHVYYVRPQAQLGQNHTTHQQSRDVSLHIKQLEADVVIFWGSQSGTAERLAQRLAKDLHAGFSLKVLTADLSDYDPSSMAAIPAATIAVFLLATYGEGGPSDNAIEFWSWLSQDSLPELAHLRYLAFGLGNSNYKYYNKVVDVVCDRLEGLGATCLSPVRRADEAAGTTEEDYLAWTDDVYKALQKELGVSRVAHRYAPAISLEVLQANASPSHMYSAVVSQRDQHRAAATSPTKCLPIRSTRHLTASDKTRTTLHMELDLADHPELRYKTGDHLVVWPINPEDEITRLLNILGRSDTADEPIAITSLDPATGAKGLSTTPTTLREILRHQLDICGPVSRTTASELAEFAPTEEARALLAKLGGDRADFARHAGRSFTTLAGLLSFCVGKGALWRGLPLPYLLESRPALQPRYYSISSSSVLAPRRVSITVRVVSPDVPVLERGDAVTVQGLASHYLLRISDTVPQEPARSDAPSAMLDSTSGHVPSLCCQVRRTKFKLPIATTTPVIMIANGTGIAPFRAFIQERADQHAVGRAVGRMMLFFGCRQPGGDYLYEDELRKAQQTLAAASTTLIERGGGASGPSTGDSGLDVKAAFSRLALEQEGEYFKGYVQDAVAAEVRTLVSMLVEGNASLYICGGANMAREVSARVAQGYADLKQVDDGTASEWVSGCKRTGKWMEDVWD